MKSILLLPAASLGFLLLLSACQSSSSDQAQPNRFAQADLNGDGKLTRQEASDYLVTTIFDTRDENRDGRMTLAEWNGAHDPEVTRRFPHVDGDKDGVVTLEEAKAYARKTGLFDDAFKAADTNHDGFVTEAEARAYYASKEGPVR